MSKKELEKKELLYSYWEKLPLIVSIGIPGEEVLTHEVRNLILYFIRKGKEEKWIEGTKRFRYSFSAKELLDMANKKLGEKMKLQSMYFHLQKMQEFGLLDVVATLHEGRHNVAYFGRTARGFLFESKKDRTKYDDYFAEAGRFAKALNPKISGDQFKDLLKEFKAINIESDEQLKQWLEERAEFINENNIDSATMYSFLRRINYHNRKMTALMEKVAELIDLEF
ncbi:MAG: hypothetical protein KGD59_07730 [Candidatus Heimdallarchaeota archaeon]|nr:hypothetical protein [Candidatus Heimdallarchaeota archaeon]MBY8994425.1 hypothetical protein [Candidatus Heimdallarchaeota archaeon]